jgi:HNH endonuclease
VSATATAVVSGTDRTGTLAAADPEIAAWLARRARRVSGGGRRARSRLDVFRRDGWTCQLCVGRIDRRLRHPSLFAATLDHRIPRSLGGPSTFENLQAAHAICNHVRGDLALELVDPEHFAAVRLATARWLRAQRRYERAARRLARARHRWERTLRRARTGRGRRRGSRMRVQRPLAA